RCAVLRTAAWVQANAQRVLPPNSALLPKVALAREKQLLALNPPSAGHGHVVFEWAARHGVRVAPVPGKMHRLTEFAQKVAAQAKRASVVDSFLSCASECRDPTDEPTQCHVCTCPLNRHDGSMLSVCGATGADTPVSVAIRQQQQNAPALPPCFAAFTGDTDNRRWEMAKMVSKIWFATS
ncbi:MAG: hypothetical protein ACPGR8_12400, partial [Limisphaerales bacterium]